VSAKRYGFMTVGGWREISVRLELELFPESLQNHYKELGQAHIDHRNKAVYVKNSKNHVFGIENYFSFCFRIIRESL